MKLKFWNTHGLLKLVIPLVLGIGVSQFFCLDNNYLHYSLIAISVFLVFIANFYQFNISNLWVANSVIFISFFLFGFSNFQLYQTSIPPKIKNYKAQKSVLALEVVDQPLIKQNSTSLVAKILKVDNNELINKKAIVYLSNEHRDTIKKGDILFTATYVNKIQGPKNPHEFDYREYMRGKSILYQTYINDKSVLKVIHSGLELNFIEKLRVLGDNYIDKYLDEENAPIAKALLLGQKEELSADVKQQFVNAGTMHILAVSGLHVGILFLITNYFLQLFNKIIRIPKWLWVLVSLAVIWIFVFLTGAKSSVSRAGIMFTFFTIGLQYFPKSYSLNTLALAAIILLSIYPQSLFDVGFQLSFSAVAGILILVPFFREVFPKLRQPIATYFLDITYVSMAAQLATLPFTLYYFQQFPTLGLVSNLVAIPIAFGVVSIGVLGFLFSAISPVASLLTTILDLLLLLLNKVNHLIADLPFSTISNIYLTDLNFIFLLIVVFLILILVKSRQKQYLFASLSFLILLFSNLAIQKWQASRKNQLMVYSIDNNVVIQYQQGRRVDLIAKNQISDNAYTYNILPNLKANFIQQKNFLAFTDTHNGDYFFKDGFLLVGNKTMYVVEEDKRHYPNTDFLLLDKLDYKSLNELVREIENQNAIIANTYPNRYVSDTIKNLHFLKTENYYVALENEDLNTE